GHVYKTTSAGGVWMDISGNLPDVPVTSLLIDPTAPNILYAATDAGVFVATDGGSAGESWQRFGAGLPNVTVLQLAYSAAGPAKIIAATHGRGAWSIPALVLGPFHAGRTN